MTTKHQKSQSTIKPRPTILPETTIPESTRTSSGFNHTYHTHPSSTSRSSVIRVTVDKTSAAATKSLITSTAKLLITSSATQDTTDNHLQFRCSCPMSIVDPDTMRIKRKAPVVYLEESSHLLFNISVPKGTVCSDTTLKTQCQQECRNNVYRYYRLHGPNELITANKDHWLLGDYICQQTSKMAGALTAHYQLLDCLGSSISPPVFTIDKDFYCYHGDYCSKTYRRQIAMPFRAQYDSCSLVKEEFNSVKRCSCSVGVSTTQIFELKTTIAPKNVTGNCLKAVSECHQYCLEHGAYIHFRGGIAIVTEEVWESGQPSIVSLRINDLLCDRLKLASTTKVKSSLYSQVEGCANAYTEGGANSTAVSLVSPLRFTTPCK